RQPREGRGQGRDRPGSHARARAAARPRRLAGGGGRREDPAARSRCQGARRSSRLDQEAALGMAEPSTVARPYAEAAFRLADGARAWRGNTVIDGSARAQLGALETALKA